MAMEISMTMLPLTFQMHLRELCQGVIGGSSVRVDGG